MRFVSAPTLTELHAINAPRDVIIGLRRVLGERNQRNRTDSARHPCVTNFLACPPRTSRQILA